MGKERRGGNMGADRMEGEEEERISDIFITKLRGFHFWKFHIKVN